MIKTFQSWDIPLFVAIYDWWRIGEEKIYKKKALIWTKKAQFKEDNLPYYCYGVVSKFY